MSVTRIELLDKEWRQDLAQSTLAAELLSEAELAESLAETLKTWNRKSDLWVFAYGSLMWNPQIHFQEKRLGIVHGYHRSFCLWSRVNRGTPQQPGLALGLDRGGSCRGLAYRIAAGQVIDELRLLWRREMLLDAYSPRWLKFRTGRRSFPVLAFVVNCACSGYAGRLSDAELSHALRHARGRYGSSADYLLNTIKSLAEYGIEDRNMLRLAELLRAKDHLPRANSFTKR